MIMFATVLRVDANQLLVRDMTTGNEVLVNWRGARNFRVGDIVRISYSGAMTRSIPPQISPNSVVLVSRPQPQPRPPQPQPQPRPPQPRPPQPRPPQPQPQGQLRNVLVMQVNTRSLLVRNPANGQRFLVHYEYARHFCVNQRVDVYYTAIRANNPPEVTATDILPVC